MRLCPQRVTADPSVDQVLVCLVATRTNRGGLKEVGRRVEIDITSEAKISESSPTLNSGLKALRALQTTAAARASSKRSSHHSEFKRWSSGRRLRFGYEEGLDS